MEVFGVLAAGRLPSSFVQTGENQFVCELPDADNLNHVVIFMTGAEPFPNGIGATAYIRWHVPGQESNWHLLGFINNEKPSAIFKVSQLRQSTAQHSSVFGSPMGATTHGAAQIGLMVESLTNIAGMDAAEGTQASTKATMIEFGDKMIRNLVNHTESYAVSLPRPDGKGVADYIPVSAIQEWFTSFSRRFQANPWFWKMLHD